MSKNYNSISEEQCDLAEPHAAPMSESLRAFGYELPSAIADLIDNSIFARARNIWVEFIWNGENSAISITDDGNGMSEGVLVDAMRPGSRNPLESRDPDDLGRYGLGLKTASFSQCRRLAVRSKIKNGAEATRCWDLDFVADRNKWLLLREAGASTEAHFSRLNKLSHGTTVVWEGMDRVVRGHDVDNADHKRFFHGRIEAVEQHLAMVFHRFLEGRRALRIFINGNPVQAWDPFLKSERATQQVTDQRISLFQARIRVIPYVLPHNSKLTKEKHEHAAGTRGWNQHQGFYVYRNERLLVAGDWLGLGFTKEEHFKLARIQLDIPNSMDQEWEIDVTKSKARPPDALRAELKYVASVTRNKASDIYRHRGKVLARSTAQSFVYLWQQVTRRGRYFYKVNREHPLVADALAQNKKLVDPVLRAVEETVPVPLLTITNSESPESHSPAFDGASHTELVALLERVYRVMRDSKVPRKIALDRLRAMEPFDRFPEIVAAFEESHTNHHD